MDKAVIQGIKDSIDLLDFIQGQTGLVFKKSNSSSSRGVEYHGPCPWCGGKDRFHIQPDMGWWWCRQCHQEHHQHDVFDFVMSWRNCNFPEAFTIITGGSRIDTDQAREMAAQREVENIKRQKEAEEAAQNVRSQIVRERLWERFSGQQTSQSRQWWEKERGIPDQAQEAWFLGYSPDIWSDFYPNEPHGPANEHTKAYIIPYFGLDGFATFQGRFHVVNGHGPYHNYRDLGMAPFITQHNRDFDQVVVHEGAIKAMNGFLWGCGEKYQVISVPSENTLSVAVPLLTKSKKVWVWLDPDTWDKPLNAAEDWLPYPLRLGQLIKKANPSCDIRYVDVNFKVDDAIHEGLSSDQYLRILAQARPGKMFSR